MRRQGRVDGLRALDEIPAPDQWARIAASVAPRSDEGPSRRGDGPGEQSLEEGIVVIGQEGSGNGGEAGGRSEPRPARGRWIGGLAVAASLLAVVGFVVVLLQGRSDTNLETAAFTPEEALAITDSYIDAYNRGDLATVRSLVPPGTPTETPVATLDSELLHQFYLPQEAVITASNCTGEARGAGAGVASGDGTEDGEGEEEADTVVVVCDLTFHDSLYIAVGAPPWEGTLTLTVTADGIAYIKTEYREFGAADRPFELWLRRQYPDDYNDGGMRFNTWDSVEHAAQGGPLRAERVAEYAEFLATSGCHYEDEECVVNS